VRRNSGAKPGDALILTKALGVGVYSAAIKKNVLSPEGYSEMVATTTLLNKVGTELAKDPAVHAITDVTGFGLLGHGLEMARGSKLTVVIRTDALPLLTQAAALTQQGFVTGASIRNWASYGAEVKLPTGLPDWRRHLLTDPQTSGGLLVSCAPECAGAILQTIIAAGYPAARLIGHVEQGAPEVRVEAR
jgi:selenide,water dikinase